MCHSTQSEVPQKSAVTTFTVVPLYPTHPRHLSPDHIQRKWHGRTHTVGNERLHAINLPTCRAQHIVGPRVQQKAKEAQQPSSNKRSQSLSLTDRQTDGQTRAPVYTDSGQHAFWKKRTQICCNRMNPGGLLPLFLSSMWWRNFPAVLRSRACCFCPHQAAALGRFHVSVLVPGFWAPPLHSPVFPAAHNHNINSFFFICSCQDPSSPRDVLLPADSAVLGHGSKAGHFTRLSSADWWLGFFKHGGAQRESERGMERGREWSRRMK